MKSLLSKSKNYSDWTVMEKESGAEMLLHRFTVSD
jgi:hypothetical protein